MSLTAYCDFAEVRSALGVNALELSDVVLSLPVYEMGLVRELNRLSTSLNAAFSIVAAVASGSRTEVQAALYDGVRLFSVYACAKQVGVSLANFAPKEVGDGKAMVARFAGEPFEKVLGRVDDMYSALRVDLRTAYETYAQVSTGATASVVPTLFISAGRRTYDPVTGA